MTESFALRAHHDGSPLYVSSLSPSLGDVVALRLRTATGDQPEQVALRTLRDGEPHVVMAERESVTGADTWWVARISVRNIVTSYRWLLTGGAFDYAWLTAGGLVEHDVPDATDFVISATPPPPDWSSASVIYQVFPDRFARSRGDDDLPAQAPEGVELPEWAVPRAWTDSVEGRGASTPFEYFGGDLDGVRDHLGHMADLGADVLYLTPIFPAGSTHRYDASDFGQVDPLLGGDAALARLTREAHSRGLRVVGDITLNHCGRQHRWFADASSNPASSTRDYFRFDDSLEYGYECWFDVPSLPKFDHTSLDLRDALVLGEDSPVRRWLRPPFSLDGWRVDVANMAGRMGAVDVTHEFARDVRSAMSQERPDALLVAEHGHDASGDLLGDGWHGTMNYAGFTRQVWSWLRGPDFAGTFFGLPVEVPVMSGQQMVSSIRAFHARIPWRSLLASWNILGSHDTARIRTVVGSRERQRAALALAVGLPGVPMVFSGDEIGAEGEWGEDSRTPFPWNDRAAWDEQTLQDYRSLISLRRASVALAEGGLRWLHVDADTVAFVREHPGEAVLVVASRSQAAPVRLPLATLGAVGIERLFGFDASVVAEQVVVDVPSAGAGVWRIERE